ncbi:MAG TPA: CZB domain-containing protein [Terracidiphilus sp.]|nr:CZB domain-containing protein [Terracidiphilus sp.]
MIEWILTQQFTRTCVRGQSWPPYLAKPDRSLNAAEVGQENRCELGQWLSVEGHKHLSSSGFQKLCADHARFHRAVADVVRKAGSGRKVSEEIALRPKSEYAAASGAIVNDLMKLTVAA